MIKTDKIRLQNDYITAEFTLLLYVFVFFLTQILVTMHGGRIAYYRGDVKLIMEDLKNVQPMGFPSVPRLLNRVYDKVQGTYYVSS